MDIFDVLSLIGGLALFLFGMQTMGDSLEKSAGSQLKGIIGKMTSNKYKGFVLGMLVTAVIQSSSATTVMAVGFVNSGIMTLRQAINIIMGANVGTTITSWLLSLVGLEGSNMFVQLCKPSSFTPVLALIGVIFVMFSKKPRKKDIGCALLGFAVLMTGMDLMSDAVSGLKNVPEFANMLLLFSNPIFGVLAGAVLTAVIQSSSASVGILQALSSTGAITFGAAIPIIMGQNIGTCVTAMLSSVGANKNARRTALVHLYFNIIGTVVLLVIFYLLNAIFDFAFVNSSIDQLGIAIVHTSFNLLATAILFPFSAFLEKLACRTIKDTKETEEYAILDTRLFATPAIALERCTKVTSTMAEITRKNLFTAFDTLYSFSAASAAEIRASEDKVDKYEDKLGSYLVSLSSEPLSKSDYTHAAMLLRLIGDIERISDHTVNLIESAEEMQEKHISFSETGKRELTVMINAVKTAVDYALKAYNNNDLQAVACVEALEGVVDDLQKELKKRHTARLQKGECTIELGFVLQDVLTNLERISDHCSNIAGGVLELSRDDMRIHMLQEENLHTAGYEALYQQFKQQFTLA